MNTHRVLRPFEGSVTDDDGNKQPYQYKAGEIVDASTWRNTDGLIQSRYLAVLPEEERRQLQIASNLATHNRNIPKPGRLPGNRIQQAVQAAKEA